MRARLNRWLAAAWRKLNPRNPVPALVAENRALKRVASEASEIRDRRMDEARRFLAELVEAQAMCGSGPWGPGDVNAYAHASPVLREALDLREAGPVSDVAPLGAYGMYELLLQNVNWQREINYSWLEFTRWGIQQIILISRLYYLKNPIIRRLIDVCAQYVFARGVDITSEDKDAQELIREFLNRNRKVLGRCALMEAEKSKDRDGNLFWVFFPDSATGECDVRMFDSTEMQDIWTDPDDADVPQLYLRQWTQRAHDPATGLQGTQTLRAWYPAINYEPTQKPEQINGVTVNWETPVYHRKVGQVGKWLFGCPRIYPALDWAKEGRRFLEACASVRQSLSQFAFSISTKGGQQAIEGIKQQMETQVGPGAPIWDTNPPAVAGASWISGPGTTLEAFKVQGATFSPDDVRWYVIMCCMVKGLPPTFLGDMQTSNLATATSLDRPTETVFLSLQEEWIEDLTVITTYALSRSLRAPSGKLREACINPSAITIRGAERKINGQGRMRYVEKKAIARDDAIEIRVDFPAIREGDLPALVTATVEAMTLQNRGGQIVGIDEKAGVLQLMRLLDIEHAEELVEEMYPSSGKNKYDPDRSDQVMPPPIPKATPVGGVQPEPGEVPATIATKNEVQGAKATKEAVRAAFARLAEAVGEKLNGTDRG